VKSSHPIQRKNLFKFQVQAILTQIGTQVTTFFALGDIYFIFDVSACGRFFLYCN